MFENTTSIASLSRRAKAILILLKSTVSSPEGSIYKDEIIETLDSVIDKIKECERIANLQSHTEKGNKPE